MFRTIRAKYAGTCKRCGCGFTAGQSIRFGGYGRTYHLKRDCAAAADTVEPAAPAVGRTKYVSDVYEIGGNQYYRNKNGRCEDAPCCGCCTI